MFNGNYMFKSLIKTVLSSPKIAVNWENVDTLSFIYPPMLILPCSLHSPSRSGSSNFSLSCARYPNSHGRLSVAVLLLAGYRVVELFFCCFYKTWLEKFRIFFSAEIWFTLFNSLWLLCESQGCSTLKADLVFLVSSDTFDHMLPYSCNISRSHWNCFGEVLEGCSMCWTCAAPLLFFYGNIVSVGK